MPTIQKASFTNRTVDSCSFYLDPFGMYLISIWFSKNCPGGTFVHTISDSIFMHIFIFF